MRSEAAHYVRYSRLSINRLGLWFFILSEAMIFVALLFTRFYLQGTYRPPELNQVVGLLITALLLVSSLTAYRAEVAIGANDRPVFLRFTLLTIVLGILFLIGVAFEWSEALAHFPPTTGFGTIFFTLTGMHALHVSSGIVMWVLIYRNGRQGNYSAADYWGPEAVAKYWHFVDVVWVFFYPALYLIS